MVHWLVPAGLPVEVTLCYIISQVLHYEPSMDSLPPLLRALPTFVTESITCCPLDGLQLIIDCWAHGPAHAGRGIPYHPYCLSGCAAVTQQACLQQNNSHAPWHVPPILMTSNQFSHQYQVPAICSLLQIKHNVSGCFMANGMHYTLHLGNTAVA